MFASPIVLAVDQGTSSTKSLALDAAGEVAGWASVPLGQRHPAPGRVEQDPEELLRTVTAAIEEAVRDCADRVAAIGLSTQRESALVWNRRTGAPEGPLLGWQDRRTEPTARALAERTHLERIRVLTGLPLDPMFSALKLSWLLDQVDPDRSRSRAGELAVGTVDSWLVARLTGEHRIEAGNASRTQLMDLDTLTWSEELLELFGIPRRVLPRIADSDEPTGPITGVPALPPHVRINAVLGDSHAALFGHGVRDPGAVKVTLGTGSSIMGLLPDHRDCGPALARTVAWSAQGIRYAFEGNVLATGATLVWLSKVLGTTPQGLSELARADDGRSRVDLVPAFAGLGAPWWDAGAQALLTGFDLGTPREAIARAALESIPLQIEDVLSAADRVNGSRIGTVLIDGGPSTDDWLVQLTADLTDRAIERPDLPGVSAVGAAHLAGLGAGVWSESDLLALDRRSTRFTPAMPTDQLAERRSRWRSAVGKARSHPRSDAHPDSDPHPEPHTRDRCTVAALHEETVP